MAMPWFALTGGIAAVLAAWLIRQVMTRRPSKAAAAEGIPGSRGLPFIGETFQFFATSSSLELHPFFKRRLHRYGPIFKTNLLREDLIVSMDQELNHLVFQQEEKMFQIWYPESVLRIIGANSIIAAIGPFHKHIRTLVLRLFGPEYLRLVLLHDLQQKAQASLLAWSQHPTIDLKQETANMIFSNMAKKLISYDSSSSDGLWKNYDKFFQGLLSFPIYIPGMAFYKCMQGRKNVLKVLREMLDQRKKAARHETADFFDLLINDLDKNKQLMNEKIALDLLFLLLFATFETTSSAITAAVKFLTDNPEALQELTEEHDNIRKKRSDRESEITWEEYKSMEFTSHVIREALRLSNIAPVMFRKAREDVHIKGYTIPKGSNIMVTPSSVHLDPEVYKDPNSFNPWRWKDTTGPMGAATKEFMAFGGGLRQCAGSDFARLQVATFLHVLVTKYRWKAISGGNMVLSPGLQFPNGFHIKIFPKS